MGRFNVSVRFCIVWCYFCWVLLTLGWFVLDWWLLFIALVSSWCFRFDFVDLA